MKKLVVFAAAMTIVGGAYAQQNDERDPCAFDPVKGECALVYDVKISLKTTVSWAQKGKQFWDANECEWVPGDGSCFRKPGKVSLKGYAVACSCDCGFLEAAEWILWTSKWTGGQKNVYIVEGESAEPTLLNYMGKKDLDVELGFNLPVGDGLLTFAGFGKASKLSVKDWNRIRSKLTLMKSASGNVAGTLDGPECTAQCEPSKVYPCYIPELEKKGAAGESATAAFGTWSMKYNKKASLKYENGLSLPFPKWY